MNISENSRLWVGTDRHEGPAEYWPQHNSGFFQCPIVFLSCNNSRHFDFVFLFSCIILLDRLFYNLQDGVTVHQLWSMWGNEVNFPQHAQFRIRIYHLQKPFFCVDKICISLEYTYNITAWSTNKCHICQLTVETLKIALVTATRKWSPVLCN